MIQNLIWATGYNMIALPLAAGVLYNQGIIINPGDRGCANVIKYSHCRNQCKTTKN
jgi:hypothetical protein